MRLNAKGSVELSVKLPGLNKDFPCHVLYSFYVCKSPDQTLGYM